MKTGILTKSQLLLLGILVAIIVTLVAIYYPSNSEGKATSKLLKSPAVSFNIPTKASFAVSIFAKVATQLIYKHNN